jgi:ABC-type uncharacterized transport system substrate-binding protein
MQRAPHLLAAIRIAGVAAPIGSLIRTFMAALALSGVILTTAAQDACAHPHVWVTIRSALIYAVDGSIVGVRHAWRFDDMYTAFALQGIPQKQKGVFTREELAPLAEVNVTSLKEYGYFTIARADRKKVLIKDPIDYWLDFADSALTLHFTLPFKAPVVAKNLTFEIYDPTWFVDFTYADKEPVTLVGATPGCRVNVRRPAGVNVAQGQQLGEDYFNSLTATSNFGTQFANKVAVQCP